MLLFSETVFDETLVGAGPWYTGDAYHRLLGEPDVLHVLATVTGIEEPIGLEVTLEVSADSQNWSTRGTLVWSNLDHDGVLARSAECSQPYARLRVELFGGSGCRLKLRATGRSV